MDELLPLPPEHELATEVGLYGNLFRTHGYKAADMHAYARANIAAERARADALEAALQSALPIVEEYARKNPTWTNGIGPTQDPMGAHALAAAARALLEKKT